MVSWVWKYFKKIDKEKAKCTVAKCGKTLSIVGGTTRSLSSHLSSQHKLFETTKNKTPPINSPTETGAPTRQENFSTTEVTSWQTRRDNLTTEVALLQSNRDDLKAEVILFQNRRDEITTDVADLQTRRANLTAKVTELKTHQNELNTTITGLKTRRDDLIKEVAGLNMRRAADATLRAQAIVLALDECYPVSFDEREELDNERQNFTEIDNDLTKNDACWRIDWPNSLSTCDE